MRPIILATALTLMCGSAFAQGATGPAAQGDNLNKPGTANSSGSMKNTTGSSMSQDMKKNGMNKPAGGESKDGQGMSKGGAMSK